MICVLLRLVLVPRRCLVLVLRVLRAAFMLVLVLVLVLVRLELS